MQAQQLRALNDSLLDIAPLVGGNEERDNIDFPGPICTEGITVDIVGDAIFANATLGAGTPPSQLLRSDCAQRLHQVSPMSTRLHTIGGQFVVGFAVAQPGLVEIDRHDDRSRDSTEMPGPGGGIRRSSVPGKTGLSSSPGIVTGTSGFTT